MSNTWPESEIISRGIASVTCVEDCIVYNWFFLLFLYSGPFHIGPRQNPQLCSLQWPSVLQLQLMVICVDLIEKATSLEVQQSWVVSKSKSPSHFYYGLPQTLYQWWHHSASCSRLYSILWLWYDYTNVLKELLSKCIMCNSTNSTLVHGGSIRDNSFSQQHLDYMYSSFPPVGWPCVCK